MAALQRYIANKNPNLKFQNYLSASELFLQQGNYEDCRIYALKAIEIDPNQIAPSQILFIANILLIVITTNNFPNHYFILNLPLYTHDQELIKNNFMYVSNMLNPNYNPYPFASEALGYALTSWTILSCLTQKASFDEELSSKEKEKNTFEPNPEYWWPSFVGTSINKNDAVFGNVGEKTNEKNGVTSWFLSSPTQKTSCDEELKNKEKEKNTFEPDPEFLRPPLVGTSINKNNAELGIMGEKTNEKNDVSKVIEISDDEEEVDDGKRKKSLIEEEKLVESNGEEVDIEEGHFKKKKRIKMMAKSSNKVLGKGNKVDMNEIEFVIAEDNNVVSEIVGRQINDNSVESEIAEGKTLENGSVGEMTDIELKVVEDNNVESGIVGIKTNGNSVESEIVKGKTHENSNVDETTNNNIEDKSMEDDDFDEYLREDIYDEMKKFYNMDYF